MSYLIGANLFTLSYGFENKDILLGVCEHFDIEWMIPIRGRVGYFLSPRTNFTKISSLFYLTLLKGDLNLTVKELIDFLSKQNPEAKVTLTKEVGDTYIDPDDGYGETYYEDIVTDLEPYCLNVDVLGNGGGDIRWI